MNENKEEALFGPISKRAGLSIKTCEELLRAGWAYVEFTDYPPVWRHPSFGLNHFNSKKTPSHKVWMESGMRDEVSTTNYSQEIK